VVFSTQSPIASSLTRRWRIRSSSSRATASGQNATPCACTPAASAGGGASGAGHGDLGHPAAAVDRAGHPAVGDAVAVERALERAQLDPARAGRPVAARGHLLRAAPRGLFELRAGHDFIDQVPLHRPLALDAFFERAEVVGAVAAHLALVGEAREPAGAGQHREQRDLRQRHGGVAVVGHHDVRARQRQLVAAARARPVDHAHPGLARLGRGFLQRVARLVGELAEVHLEAVRGAPQHADVGPPRRRPAPWRTSAARRRPRDARSAGAARRRRARCPRRGRRSSASARSRAEGRRPR